MADKIENKPVAEKHYDNSLSSAAFDLMKGAAMGGAAGAAMGKAAHEAATHGTARGAGEGDAAKGHVHKKIESAGAAAAEGAANEATKTGKVNVGKIVGGAADEAAKAVEAGKANAGKDLGKANHNEVNKGDKAADGGVKAFEDGIRRQAKEVMDTPKDVIDHVRKHPGAAMVEGAIGGPAAVVLDAKLRKWFGDK